jgi:hypothetical protein
VCLIVDASCCTHVFRKEDDEYFGHIQAQLFAKNSKVHIVYGGKLTQEYEVAGVSRIVKTLDQAGRAQHASTSALDHQDQLIKKKRCKSNDRHILALALVSNARLLCTNDENLKEDFINAELLSNPRGSVFLGTQKLGPFYRRSPATIRQHRKLLQQRCSDMHRKRRTR